MRNKIKNERGVIITLFVVISMLTFLVIVVAAYRTVVRKEQGQIEATGQIREEYAKTTADDIYREYIGGNTISISSVEDFKIMFQVLNGKDQDGKPLTDGKLSAQLSNGKYYTLTKDSQYTLVQSLTSKEIDVYHFQQKCQELEKAGGSFAFNFAGNTLNKVEVGEIKSYNTTLTGKFYGANNPVVPAGFKAVNLDEDSSWSGVANINHGLAIQDTLGNQFVWVPVPEMDQFAKKNNYVQVLWEFDTEQKKDPISHENEIVVQLNGSNTTHKTATNIISGRQEIRNDFIKMYDNVKAYGGFYMSSYQIGNITDFWKIGVGEDKNNTVYISTNFLFEGKQINIMPRVQSTLTDTTAIMSYWNHRADFGITSTNKNTNLYNSSGAVTFQRAKQIAKQMYSSQTSITEENFDSNSYQNACQSVTSDLVWGNQWDAMLKWMYDSSDKGKGFVTKGENADGETIQTSPPRKNTGFNHIFQLYSNYPAQNPSEPPWKWVGAQHIQLFGSTVCYARGAASTPMGYYTRTSGSNETLAYVHVDNYSGSTDSYQVSSIRPTLTVNIPD